MHMKQTIKRWMILLTCFSASTTAAKMQYPTVLEQLNQLLLNKDYIQAYEFADSHTYDYGGESEFDLLLGFAAFGNERYQEAVFAFERVVLTKPRSFVGRFYLAQSYSKVDNLAAAIRELEKLQAEGLTDQQREKTNGLKKLINRQMINKKITWYQIISANIAYDDNINSATDQETIESPRGEFNLPEASLKTEDNSFNVSYMAGYQHPFNQYQWLKIDFSANHFGFEKHNEFQRQQVALNVAYEQELLRGKLSLTGYTKPLWLEQEVKSDTIEDITGEVERKIDLYRTENGVSFGFQKSTSRKHGYSIGLNYAQVVNDVSPELDFTRSKVSLAYQYKTKLMHSFVLHYQQDENDLDGMEHIAKDAVGLTYQLAWPLTSNLLSSSFIMVEQNEYQGVHPIFEEIRDETLGYVSTQLIYRFSDHQQFKFQLNAQKKDSNLPLFTYERLEAVIGWQYRF